jgi:hypothetical protein
MAQPNSVVTLANLLLQIADATTTVPPNQPNLLSRTIPNLVYNSNSQAIYSGFGLVAGSGLSIVNNIGIQVAFVRSIPTNQQDLNLVLNSGPSFTMVLSPGAWFVYANPGNASALTGIGPISVTLVSNSGPACLVEYLWAQ